MSGWEDPPIDWKHWVEDIVSQYTDFTPEIAAVVESIANSLDAGATRIEIEIDQNNKIYKIKDNGNGMSNDTTFREYHGLATTKKVKGEGIGWAGQGTKLYLKIAERIVTETKSDGYHRATEWKWIGDKPKFQFIDPPGASESRGTAVILELKKQYADVLSPESIVSVLHRYYNAILRGYGGVTVVVSGTQIQPWKPPFKKEHQVNIKIGKKFSASCIFFICDQDLEEDFRGIEVISYGKAIRRGEFFGIPTNLQNKITGWILADWLIEATNPSKTDYQKTHPRWRKFKIAVSEEFSKWINELEGRVELFDREKEKEMERLMRDVEKILRQVPELKDVFGRVTSKSVLVPHPEGDIAAELIEGSQTTEGTFTGPGTGEGVLVTGTDEGSALEETVEGSKKGTRAERSIKSGPTIHEEEFPSRDEEVWLEGGMIIINSAHPVWKKSSQLGNVVYHRLKCIVNVLIQHSGLESHAIELQKKFFMAWGKM